LKNTLTCPLKKLLVGLFILMIASAGASALALPQEKLKAEDVVAKHLAAIGPADALAAVKSIIAIGNCKSFSRMSSIRELGGVSQLASEGDKVLLAMLFDSTIYPFEKVGYNGQTQTVSILPDGKRSFLVNFLASHDAPFKQGLIGGVLSTAWPLLNVGPDMPKLSYSGLDKINDRKVHKLKYDLRKSSGLQISLFFDAETFQHVRTEYQFSISARMGVREELSVSQRESRYKLVEDFSAFKPEGKLTLPHMYKISYAIEEQNTTQELYWTVNFSRFVFNEPIDIKAFSVSSSN
jgi:hypothetical protein